MKNSLCFIGTGRIAAQHIAVIRRLFPHIRLGVASRDIERAQQFQQQHTLDASFGDSTSAIHSDFTTIVIATPPATHVSLIRETLAAGKHLLIEKPIFNSFDEFQTLWPALKASMGIVMVAENHAFDPFHCKLKHYLTSHDLGKPRHFRLVKLGVSHPTGWRSDPTHMPLGALHEGGVHWIRRLLDLASLYEDNPLTSLLGVTATEIPHATSPVPGEVATEVRTRHRSGLVSTLIHSWATPKKFGVFSPSRLKFERGIVYFDATLRFGIVIKKLPQPLFPTLTDPGGFSAMWKHFIDCIETGKKPRLTLDEIFLDFAYLDAAYRSLASHREESLPNLP